MSERSVEGRIGAIELGKGLGMKLFETSDEAAQLRLRLRIGGFIIERSPPDEFGRRYLARLGRLSLDARLVLCRDRDNQSLRRQAHSRLQLLTSSYTCSSRRWQVLQGFECGYTLP